MQIPTYLIKVFEESQNEYSEASTKQTIYVVDDCVAFSNKATAEKYQKYSQWDNGMRGGNGSATLRTMQLDSMSDKKVDALIKSMERQMKNFEKN
jgi:hypothetical protein